jgi:hypothetical protein
MIILNKLQEALAEVGKQRLVLDEIEKQLRTMISKLSGMPDVFVPDLTPHDHRSYVHNLSDPPERDRIDEVIDILRAEGKPMHITDIVKALSGKTSKKFDRTQVEPGLNRHVQKAKRKRLDKFGPSKFGLPEWKQPSLARTA